MLRISLDSPALIAVRSLLTGSAAQPMQTRRGRKASRTRFSGERLEPRMMLDAHMLARLPDLVVASDTGAWDSDNFTSDRTPLLTGSVRGPVTQVRLFIDGRRGDLLPVTNGTWTYEVPATAALAAGRHTVAVRPVDGSGRVGPLSRPLHVTVMAAAPTASTVSLASPSDSGVKGDGRTVVNTPILRGRATPGQFVNVSIDGVFAGRVRSDARTGAWSLTAPRLANGVRDVTAVVENRAGLTSAATSFELTVNGERTVMLDGSDRNTVELTASHLLGRNSQGFVVTQVHRGTLQRWSAARNAWVTIPAAPLATTAATLQNPPANRRLGFNEVVRWTPGPGEVGTAPAFSIRPLDMPGGLTAPTPEAATVPGKVVNAQIAPLQGGVGSTVTWGDPTDGCGCGSTRYSVEVTRQDGQTLVYSVPRTVHGIPLVEGGAVQQLKVWGATKTGAGEARSYDAITTSAGLERLGYTLAAGASFANLGKVARAQLGASLTPPRSTGTLPLGGTNAHLAYLEVKALPTATEAAQGLPAGIPMIISSESNALSPAQLADLRANPIYASRLFPGTVNGEVRPDQVRAHFQAGQVLQFSGTVDPSVRAGATIVVEAAQNLGDGSLGPWFEKGRIAVGADGSYSHDYVVPYGLNSVRMRLEYRTAPASTRAASVGATSTSTTTVISTPIDLSGSFNAFGITTAPWQAPNHQGFDRNGNYYNSDYTGSGTSAPIAGTPIVYNGISFPIGPIPTEDSQVGGSGNSSNRNPFNFVQATGQKIDVSVDAEKSDYLYLAGAASNGNQMSQKILLEFTDGTTETWTQSFHDWASYGPPQSDATTTPATSTLPVKIATDNNVMSLSGEQTIDGTALVAGDRILLTNQSWDAAGSPMNGIYVVSTGAWSRAKDADTGAELTGAYTYVMAGDYAGKTFVNTNTSIELGQTALTYVEGTPPVPAPRPFAGELLLKTEPERINQLGTLVTTPAHIFAYCRNLKGKQLASITLPNNNNIGILSAVVAKAPVIALDQGIASVVLGTTNLTGIDLMALTIKNESNIGVGGGPLTFFMADTPVSGTGSSTQPPTYTTTQVTVPMGQQVTIACVAPDSTSQMTFYVQKADGTCVGPNCSTYLTDWSDGSGRSSDFAANISPSLNSQMKSGQHWTMTIQNSAEGYYGYLDSPSGQGLPGANGSTPAGAQFKLMTQAEINSQPPWATALEEAVGILIGVAVLTVATGGVADFFIADATVVDTAGTVTADVTGEVAGSTTQAVTESVEVDANAVADGDATAQRAGRRIVNKVNISRGWWRPMEVSDWGQNVIFQDGEAIGVR